MDNRGGLHAEETFVPALSIVSKAVRTRNFKDSLKLEFEEYLKEKRRKKRKKMKRQSLSVQLLTTAATLPMGLLIFGPNEMLAQRAVRQIRLLWVKASLAQHSKRLVACKLLSSCPPPPPPYLA